MKFRKVNGIRDGDLPFSFCWLVEEIEVLVRDEKWMAGYVVLSN